MMPRAKFHANPLKTVAVHTEQRNRHAQTEEAAGACVSHRIRDVDQLKSSLVSYDFMAV